jgi:ammonia channel protein AmtB
MVPGLAMFYGGLVRTKNVIGTMMPSFAAIAVINVLWVVFGYALIYFIVEKSVGFRIEEESEVMGLDQSLHGEHGYGLIH